MLKIKDLILLLFKLATPQQIFFDITQALTIPNLV